MVDLNRLGSGKKLVDIVMKQGNTGAIGAGFKLPRHPLNQTSVKDRNEK